MSIVLRLSTCLLITAAFAACNKTESNTPTASTGTPASAPAQPATQAPAPVPASAAADDAPIVLDMGKLKAWMQAQKNLAQLARTDPAMEDSAQNVSEEDTTKYVARLDANARMRDAIQAAGLSTRDFANIGETLIAAMMAQAALEGGQLKTLPAGVDAASVDFVKQHKTEIQTMFSQGAASSS